MLLIGAILLTILLIWHKLPGGFLPEEDQGYVMVMVTTPEASSLQITRDAMIHTDRIIRRHAEVLDTSFAAGFNMMAGIASTNNGVVFVALQPYDKRSKSAMQIARELTDELYWAIPEATCYAFIPPAIPGLGVTSGITIELQDLEGHGSQYLSDAADRLIEALGKESSIAAVTTQFNDGIPQRRLRIDKEQALAMGVDLSTLYGDLSALLGGRYINNFNRFGKMRSTGLGTLLCAIFIGTINPTFVVDRGRRYRRFSLRITIQSLPIALIDYYARRRSFHGDRHGTHRTTRISRVARRCCDCLEWHFIPRGSRER